MQNIAVEALYRGTIIGEHKSYGQQWNGTIFDWAAPVVLGEGLTFYRRKMRDIYKGKYKVKVYHGTSLSSANNIIKYGFLPTQSRGRFGIFVSSKKNVSYALEHTYSGNDGVIIECEVYLQEGKYIKIGDLIILNDPLSIIPLKIYKTTNIDNSVSTAPPMLHRSKNIGSRSNISLID